MAYESKLKAQARELKPCPFCGEQDIYSGNQPSSYFKHYRECGRCLVRILGYETSEEADAAWNTRHEQVKAETADLRARLFEAEQVLKMIWHRGHNDDCLFCGLKDREVKAYADKYLPDFNSGLQTDPQTGADTAILSSISSPKS